jgi:small subunit ribosomal protein S6
VRPYEVAIILDATLDDTIIRQTTDGILEFVRSKDGKTGRVDRWGRRAFAYEMKHKTEGYYLFVDVTAEPQVLADLDRMLVLSDDVIRHRIIRLPEGNFTRREIRSPRESSPIPEPVVTPDAVPAEETDAPAAPLPSA